jgi:hypothetical protein
VGQSCATASRVSDLGITDHAQHWQPQLDHRGQELFHHLGLAGMDIFRTQHSTGEDVPHQINGFIAFIRLDAINRKQHASIRLRLFSPRLKVGEYHQADALRGARYNRPQTNTTLPAARW